jgi:hypothetical protein
MYFNTGLTNDVETTRDLADQVNQEIGGGGFLTRIVMRRPGRLQLLFLGNAQGNLQLER